MKYVAMWALAFTATMAPSTARAEWYGGETLASDAISSTLVIAGLKLDSGGVMITGAAGLLVGSPIIHAVHENAQSAAISFGLRAAVPLIAYAAGRASDIDDDDYGWGALGVMFTVAAIGTIAAVTVDSAVLARKDDDAMPAPRMVSFGGHF